MDDLLSYLKTFNDTIAQQYNLDVNIFFAIYLTSFIPFYFGYFLIIYGSTRKLSLKDIFHFKLKNKLQWNQQSKNGLYIHLFGRVMPYAYILIFGRNFSLEFYLLLFLIMFAAIFFVVRRIFVKSKILEGDIKIIQTDYVNEDSDIRRLWEIYNGTFEYINRLSPCKQSLDKNHFEEVLKDTTVKKYLMIKDSYGYIGIALVTNRFKNIPWISEEYFKAEFPAEHSKDKIFYFMGLAIDKSFRGRRYSISLIEYIIDDVPHEAVVGFDHSKNINPILHFFTKIVKQARSIRGRHIDRQHYHIIRRV